MSTVDPGAVLADLDAFRARTAEAEYTDTGEAWELIDKLESALRQALSLQVKVDCDHCKNRPPAGHTCPRCGRVGAGL